jgi:hypothetical protein
MNSSDGERGYSYNEFLADLAIEYETLRRITPPNKLSRLGQFYLEMLMTKRPAVADSIAGSEFDPRFQDELSDELHEKVELLW